MKVLVADNHAHTLNSLCDLLEMDGFETVRADSGTAALAAYHQHRPDFICLDIMMEDKSGHEVCKDIRREDTETPIIFISSRARTADKVEGLELGADDYIVKPFDIEEVTARIRAVARRCLGKVAQDKKEQDFSLRDVIVQPGRLKALRGEEVIDLSLREVKILRLFHDRAGEVVTRDMLMDHCWGRQFMPESRVVDWQMSQLRKKLDKNDGGAGAQKIIDTVHGAGYRFSK